MKKQLIMTVAAVVGLGLAASSFAMMTYGPTKEGDTMWKIAHHHHIHGVSNSQFEAAVRNLNPKAFAHNGSLKASQTLQLPTTKEEVTTAVASAKSAAKAAPASSTAAPAPVVEKVTGSEPVQAPTVDASKSPATTNQTTTSAQ